MNSIRTRGASRTTLDATVAGGGTIELVAVVTSIVGAACVAAALLLTTPAMLEAAASTTAVGDVADRPFHEPYRISASDERADPPTF